MSDGLLSALQRRFAAQADLLPQALPAIESEDPTAFLVRYRRDALAGLPEPVFRKLRAAAREEHDLERRRAAARRAIEKAGKLTDELALRLAETRDLVWLEDLQRPLRREAGVADPMIEVARRVFAGEAPETLEELLKPFCGADGAPPTAADQRQRLVGLVAGLAGDDPDLRAAVRAEVRRHGVVATEVDAKHAAAETWRPFAEMKSPIGEIDGRALLLIRRGQKLGAVKVHIHLPDESRAALLAGPLAPREGRPHADVLADAAKEAIDRILLTAAGSALLADRRRQASRSLLPRLQRTLQERLMMPPAGQVPVVAVAPGTPGSCRLLVVDAQGRHGASAAVHPFPPQNEREASHKALADMIRESGAKIVAVAGSRKARATRAFAEEALAACRDLGASIVLVNELPAAAWSESDEAKAETPELAASARAALGIGRSVQDPVREASRWDLTELPLDPHQRDIDQGDLRSALDDVLAECVADVGVDVNTAPLPLLARVPGLGVNGAKAIVAAREAHGTFASRAKVREVEGITEEQWQRAGGFLRVRDGVDPLDATGVHPTGLGVVAAIAAHRNVAPAALIGAEALLDGLDPAQFAGPVHTASDVESVLQALRAGTSDPRTVFVPPAFNPGLRRLKDLEVGMEVEGVVASVSNFGAFVDLGVRQHGLVHVSEMSHEFVQDPSQAVQVGQKVKVKVLGIDPAKRRISLSMKALLPAPERPQVAERPPRERAPGGGFDRGSRAPSARGGPGGGFGGPGGGPVGPPPGYQGDRGPRAPRREGPGGGPGGAPGRPARPGRDDRRDGPPGPGGFRPERPGTAPRRAGRGGGRFGKGDDRGKGDQFGLSRDREARKGRGAEAAADEGAEMASHPRPVIHAVDPFLAQLQAAASQLGVPVPRQAPRPQPRAAEPEGPKNRRERRAQMLAQRAADEAAAAARGEAAPVETSARAEVEAEAAPVETTSRAEAEAAPMESAARAESEAAPTESTARAEAEPAADEPREAAAHETPPEPQAPPPAEPASAPPQPEPPVEEAEEPRPPEERPTT